MAFLGYWISGLPTKRANIFVDSVFKFDYYSWSAIGCKLRLYHVILLYYQSPKFTRNYNVPAIHATKIFYETYDSGENGENIF